MVFTCYSAGNTCSSICVQDIGQQELHYEICMLRLINIITRFLYQICLTDKSDEISYLYV